MSGLESCPHCGVPLSPNGTSTLAALTHQIDRIHDIAGHHVTCEEQQRIEDLTREVQHLRETVARLRGAGIH
jgi:hypothetical protein